MSSASQEAFKKFQTKAANSRRGINASSSSTNEVPMQPIQRMPRFVQRAPLNSTSLQQQRLPPSMTLGKENKPLLEESDVNASDAPLLDLNNMDEEDQVEFYDKQVAGIRYGVSVSGLVLVSVLIVLVSVFIWALTTLGYFVIEQTQVVIVTVCFVLPLLLFVLLSLVKNIVYFGWVLGLAFSVLSILIAANGLYDVIDTINAAAKLTSTTGKYDVVVYLTSALFNIVLLALCVSVVYMLLTTIWEVSELASYRPRVRSKKGKSES